MHLSDDRVIRFIDACNDAGIKRPDSFLLAKMPQVYNWLIGAFPRGILPTDIDGEVEINGHFLRLEFKHETALRSGRIAKGQHRALSKLIECKKFTVLLIGTNDQGEPTCIEEWHNDGTIIPIRDCTKQDVRHICSLWANYVERLS